MRFEKPVPVTTIAQSIGAEVVGNKKGIHQIMKYTK
jgi:hypothetical protein